MERSVVYMPMANGCSGQLLWRPDGQASGAMTAEHCYLHPEVLSPITGGDGKSYIVRPDLLVRSGPDVGSFVGVGRVGQVVLSPSGANRDLALFVFEGHTVAEVLADYDRGLITPAELAGLPRGAVVRFMGYPDHQPGSRGIKRVQAWDAAFIGPVTTNPKPFSVERRVTSLMLSVRPNADGALCTPGQSGAGAAISFERDGEVVTRHLGVNSAADDFRRDDNFYTPDNPSYIGPDVRAEREIQFGMPPGGLRDVEFACYIAFERPGSDRVVLEVVDDASRIPG